MQPRQPARRSWQEKNKEEHPEFLEANTWQRETIETRVDSQDGFLVLIGLFVVLVLENLWSLEPDTFASKTAFDAFLALLVCGAACGVFAIFSMTMIRLKLQRLLVRDIAALNVQQVVGQQNLSRLDRLANAWVTSSADRQFQPACLSYEWYHGGGIDTEGYCFSTTKGPGCPRTLVKYASLSFAAMVLCPIAALAIRLADTKGLWWSILCCTILGAGVFLPIICIRASSNVPPGLPPSESNPFHGF